jgi:hypothetical protein
MTAPSSLVVAKLKSTHDLFVLATVAVVGQLASEAHSASRKATRAHDTGGDPIRPEKGRWPPWPS